MGGGSRVTRFDRLEYLASSDASFLEMGLVAVVVLAGFLLAACATPAQTADQAAHARSYQKLLLTGTRFNHVAYFKPGDTGQSLHVYIEHDGIPWRTPTEPAADPTPRNLYMLELMASDAAPSLYLGRPCYFGMADVPPCEPIWWTHCRFSKEVIQSMDAALRSFVTMHTEFISVEFYGYSGGGVVAALMASNLRETRRLVTVAAPLDLKGWARLHGFAPLVGSMSPIEQSPLPEGVAQLHLAGGHDNVVPDFLIRPFAERQYGAKFIEVPSFDHYCCWGTIWQRTVLGQ